MPFLPAFALAACDSPTAPDADAEIQLVVVSGNGQAGVVGQMLGTALTVRVGTSANPVAGALVNFVVARGGGTVWAGSALTDARGLAREWWTLGTNSDSLQVVEVRAVAPNGTRRVYGTFTADALADVPARIERVVPQAVTPELMVVEPAAGLRVFDRYNNSVPAYPVHFNVRRGGGTVSDTVLTDATGLALAVWTPGAFNPLDSIAQIRMRAVGFQPPSPDSIAVVQTRVYPVSDRTLVVAGGDGQTSPVTAPITLCVGMQNGEGGSVMPHAHHVQAVTWTRNGQAVTGTPIGGVSEQLCYSLVHRPGPNEFRATIRGMAGDAVFHTTGT